MGIDTQIYIEVNFGNGWSLIRETMYIPSRYENEIWDGLSSFNRLDWDDFKNLNPSDEMYKHANMSDYDLGIWFHQLTPSIRMFVISI